LSAVCFGFIGGGMQQIQNGLPPQNPRDRHSLALMTLAFGEDCGRLFINVLLYVVRHEIGEVVRA
jgi:hypothetical protein